MHAHSRMRMSTSLDVRNYTGRQKKRTNKLVVRIIIVRCQKGRPGWLRLPILVKQNEKVK
jgi:hypothetical protein